MRQTSLLLPNIKHHDNPFSGSFEMMDPGLFMRLEASQLVYYNAGPSYRCQVSVTNRNTHSDNN
jgi:hypothetical protein